jgi:hypothetical protein
LETALVEAWARGVAANPGTPVELLLRLLDPAGHAAWETLCGRRAVPDEVVDAVVAHPEDRVRRMLARNPLATPEQRGRFEAVEAA